MLNISASAISFKDNLGKRVVVRPTSKLDRNKIVEMYSTLNPDDRCLGLPPVSRQAIEAWVDYILESSFSLVAECDDKIVGHCAVIPMGRNLELCIFVHSNYQNRGIGQQMIRTMIKLCRQTGFKGICLITERNNVRAIHVFKKAGFKIVDCSYDCEMYLQL